MTIKAVPAAVLGLALVLTACTSTAVPDTSSQASSQASTDPGASADAATEAPEVDRAPSGELPTISFDEEGLPTMETVAADPPTVITVKTLTSGDGTQVTAGDYVQVNYAGFLWTDGSQFDSSYENGEPVGFSLDQVVDGWKYGLAGTHVGDRVLVVVPPDYGYGDEESDSIPAGSTLVFVVDILTTITVTTEALTSATPTQATLPAGVTVTGDLGTEPTLTFAADAVAPTEEQAIVLAEGTGAVVTETDSLLYHVVGGYWGEETSSSWSASYQQIDGGGGEATVGKRVGSRLLLIYPADEETETPAEAIVIDLLAAIPAAQ
ncbi:MAG: FKBP-type peptidyl-prolyl cis-trans isomerase [Propionicimonas sp.]|nr:FKBP-type peptidyl-prolyl cis-trans isomerase [Propionicimonas sp.]